MISEWKSNYFFLESQLDELKTGTDVAKIFEEEKLLQKNHNKQKFKEALQDVGRTDLAVKLEKILDTGKSRWQLPNIFNQKNKQTE